MKKILLLLLLSLSTVFSAELFVSAGGYNGSAVLINRTPGSATTETSIGVVSGTDITLGMLFEDSTNRLELSFDDITVGDNGLTGLKFQGFVLNWVWNFEPISFLADSQFFFSFGGGSYVITDTSFSYMEVQTALGFNLPLFDNFELELSGKRKNLFAEGSNLSRLSTYSYVGVRYFF